jgi:outer membrane protein assembly factor BamB
MRRWIYGWLVAAGCAGAVGREQGLAAEGLIDQSAAERQGLTRSWFAQLPLDPARSRIAYITQHQGLLLAQTDRAMVAALDAESGRTLWATMVGNPKYPSLAPGANDKFVAIVNGSTIYVLDRATGEQVWQRQVPGAPGAGPALSKTHVFVPMIDGKVEGYELERPKHFAWNYKSFGRTLLQPVVTPERLGWTTDQGYFYVASTTETRILYRLETRDAIVSSPTYFPPHFYAASLDGNVYAVEEESGNSVWRFSLGQPVRQPPAAVAGQVYVIPEQGGMFCLDGATGAQRWRAPGITHFLAASPSRVYGFDRGARLVVLDGQSGAALGTVAARDVSLPVLNQRSDRIYLATDRGLVQCLREIASREPVEHLPAAVAEEPAVRQKPLDEPPPAAEPQPSPPAAAGGDDPFADPAPAADAPEAEMPAEADDAPAQPAAEADDPFGP